MIIKIIYEKVFDLIFLYSILNSQFLIVQSSVAQKLYLEIKSEFNKANLKYDWDIPIPVDDPSQSFELNYNFSIGLSGQVYKNLYLKATVGTNDLRNAVDIGWVSEFDDRHSLRSWLSLNQNYLITDFESKIVPS